jgi:hypothetical protein
MNIQEFSTNINTSKDIDFAIKDTAYHLKKVFEDNFPNVKPPIIAGGCVRDYVFGTFHNNYDIFFDLSSLRGFLNEDDTTLLIASLLKDARAAEFRGFSIRKINTELPRFADKKDKFTQQELYEYALVDEKYIGCKDTRLQTDIESFVESFDYPLVKCWFDTSDMKYHFSKEFMKVLETKEIYFTHENNAFRRFSNWKSRFPKDTFPFKVRNLSKEKRLMKRKAPLLQLPLIQPTP